MFLPHLIVYPPPFELHPKTRSSENFPLPPLSSTLPPLVISLFPLDLCTTTRQASNDLSKIGEKKKNIEYTSQYVFYHNAL